MLLRVCWILNVQLFASNITPIFTDLFNFFIFILWIFFYVFYSSQMLTLNIINFLSGNAVSWQDGSALEYSNWKSLTTGEKSEPQCAVLIAGQNASWTLVSCKVSHSRVVCKTEASEYHSCSKGKYIQPVSWTQKLQTASSVVVFSSFRGAVRPTVSFWQENRLGAKLNQPASGCCFISTLQTWERFF